MVYVDDAAISFTSKVPGSTRRPMKMNHMVADTHEELVAMALRIGVQVKWIQNCGTWKEHFDIATSKRKLAVENGAQEISRDELYEFLSKKLKETCNG